MEPVETNKTVWETLIGGLPDKLYKISLEGTCVPVHPGTNLQPSVAGQDSYRNLSDWLDAEIASAMINHVAKAVNTGLPETFEYKIEGEQGNFLYYEARLVKHNDREVLAIVRDISNSVRKIQDIEAWKELYEDIIDHVNMDIAVLDDRSRYVVINRSALHSPHLRKWIIGKDDAEYSQMKGNDPEIAEARMKMYGLADQIQEPVEWIEEIADTNGSKRIFVRTVTPFSSGSGSYKLGYGVDITALRVVQDQLKRREHLLAFSHKLARIGYWVYYPEDSRQEWSDGIYDIFDLPKEIRGPSLEKFYSVIHPEDLEKVKRSREDQLKKLTSWSLEYRIVTGNGTVKYIKEESSSATGEQEYIFGVIQDMTEIKQHILEREELLREINNKYTDLMQFNYIVSHNLRSPVANILGMSSLFSMELAEDERKQIFQYISESAESIDAVIKDLNRILSVKSVLNEKKEPLCLSTIIDKVANDLFWPIKESGAEITMQIATEADAIFSIKGYIHSVFHNLISNALKYKSDLRVPEIRITAEKDGEYCLIRVSDNGIGIDLEKYGNQIFGLYKRFTMGPEGRGLGLHMTKAQIESLGGSIDVDSEVGKGTTFTISLPL
ncbi:sensor histidine kinase [Pararcticibacter amylolyticus]|uniref:histidine kinase n=1 Tax=Pararcticibacter amylolyticus TaxID=2173175 RepID=A0A2U2PBD2_9SPHI|nr:PAS domain-containing sensor histidine kinase [Pararcticibacter amylolyticus]PWG78665.1 hypothetical protein DDR33_20775 [Pararcticibacter amylolyticus]